MRARAQKKKKAAGEAEGTLPPPSPAVEPVAVEQTAVESPAAEPSPAESSAVESSAVASASAESAGDAEGRRAIPDPQGPPVVAPVLMPAVVLADREDMRAAAVGATDDSGAIAPVAEMLMPVASPAGLAITERGYELPPAEREDARPSPSTTSSEARADDGGASDDGAWHAPDEARLLVQSPRRLFLYWRFARDPRELLREALGPVAERFGPAVRLVDTTTGEEGEPAPAAGSDYWFDVLPGRLLRADVGFHGEGLPFVRLISSNTVETPAVGVSRAEDEAPEFRVAEPEFERVLEATGFAAEERREEPARLDTREDSGGGGDTARPFAADRYDDPIRQQREPTREPPRPRASSDTARPASSPRDGGHFPDTRGGELF